MNKILLIEDEENIRGFLKINLKRNNFEVIEAASGEEGLNLVRKEKPDIVVLDIMLPGIDGFRVCQIIREENKNIGIIMLTAKGQDMDKIMGLEYGADDYIVKPFNPLEVVLRIKAILRRLKEDNSAVIKIDKYMLDTYSKKFYKDGKEVYLTTKEYLIVKTFMENPNRAFSRGNYWMQLGGRIILEIVKLLM
ncbi:response regulator [Caproiciproducens sp. MSJ-32]|nr:response regulator [Caproiciproducens sp. MSJ-32]